jgi:hypothetical protein
MAGREQLHLNFLKHCEHYHINNLFSLFICFRVFQNHLVWNLIISVTSFSFFIYLQTSTSWNCLYIFLCDFDLIYWKIWFSNVKLRCTHFKRFILGIATFFKHILISISIQNVNDLLFWIWIWFFLEFYLLFLLLFIYLLLYNCLF